MTTYQFIKMHGLGNDFVVFDERAGTIPMHKSSLLAVADRNTGIGCDQVIILGSSGRADLSMRIYNADGSEAEACGNAARCVAKLAMTEKKSGSALIETPAGLLRAEHTLDGLISIDMGIPKFSWKDIPLSHPQDTLNIELEKNMLSNPVALSMGNPHAVFFVEDLKSIPLELLGPDLEHDPIFPEKANIGVAEIKNDREIRLKVWERGAGLTQACGTGACAALVAAHRRQLFGRAGMIHTDGGLLNVEWKTNNHVLLIGPAVSTFVGKISIADLP